MKFSKHEQPILILSLIIFKPCFFKYSYFNNLVNFLKKDSLVPFISCFSFLVASKLETMVNIINIIILDLNQQAVSGKRIPKTVSSGILPEIMKVENPYKETMTCLKSDWIGFADLGTSIPNTNFVNDEEFIKGEDYSYVFESEENDTLFANLSSNKEAKTCPLPADKPNEFIPGENAARQDVVHKTLVRCIKRYYCEEFWDGSTMIYYFHKPNGAKCLERIDQVRTLIRNFFPFNILMKTILVYWLIFFIVLNG